MIKAAIFDMDGTILNTLDDLTDAVNYAMEQAGHRHDYTARHTQAFFGSGARVALTRALYYEKGMALRELEFVGTDSFTVDDETERETMRVLRVFQGYYPSHSEIKTRPYDGINDAVRELREKGILTAVVSNKMDEAVQGLCVKYFDGLFDVAVGENEPHVKRKPAPDMTRKAMEIMGVTADEAVYIGDSEIDMQTAENSGLDCVSVAWGFRSREFLESHGAGTIIDGVHELKDAILNIKRGKSNG